MFHVVRSRRIAILLTGILAVAVVASVGVAAEASKSVKFSKRCLMVSANEGCVVADVDKDGKLDIVAGPNWFAGPDFVPRPLRDVPEMRDGEFLCNNGDHVWDVDGDGWLDVISGGWLESEIYWFKNPGKARLARGMKWERQLLNNGRGQNEAYDLHDFDGDGVPEIYVSCWDENDPQVVWKMTKKDGKPGLERFVLGPKGGHGYAFGDINGDGREDVHAASGWYERPEGNPLGQPWKFHPEAPTPHGSCPGVIVDVNGDGRNDIIWGKAHDYGLFWWEQGESKPDGTRTWTQHDIDKSWSQVHCLVWADIDGDGQGELITGKRVRGHGDKDPGSFDPTCIFYYAWDKAAKQFTRHTIAGPGENVGTGMQIRVVDLNGDKKLDIVVSGKTGTWVLMNEGVK